MNLFRQFILGVMLAVGLNAAAAAEEAPEAMVVRVTQEVLQAAAADRDIRAGDRRKIRALVEQKIMPHVDFSRTTSLAAGRHWRGATAQQQQQLTREFASLLIHTYSGALSIAGGKPLEFRLQRGRTDDLESEVQMQILQGPGSEPLQIGYRLHKSADGWKVYDIGLLGAWLVDTYKGNFSAEIGRTGVDGLISVLAERNRKLELAARPAQRAGT